LAALPTQNPEDIVLRTSDPERLEHLTLYVLDVMGCEQDIKECTAVLILNFGCLELFFYRRHLCSVISKNEKGQSARI
jgi:hypothetical protein